MQKDKSLVTSMGGGKQRVRYLDIAKGLLIILLVFAHFRSALARTDFENELFVYVYGWNSIFICFYMPAFFLISGYCSNFKKGILSFTKSLLRNLLLPLFALSLINDIAYSLMVTHQDLTTVLLNAITRGGTLWFIQALILAKVVCYIIQKFTDSRIAMLLLTIMLLVIGVALNQFKVGSNPFYYQHGLVASFFVSLGIYLKENPIVYEKMLERSLLVYPFIGIVNFWYSPSLTAFLSVSLKTLPLFLILSTCGTLFLLAICKKMRECRWIEFWGRNSLVVYGLHFAPYVFFFNAIYGWMYPTEAMSFIGFLLLLFIAEYTLCYILMHIFQYKPFKWLLGRY